MFVIRAPAAAADRERSDAVAVIRKPPPDYFLLRDLAARVRHRDEFFPDAEFLAEARKLSKEDDPSKGAANCVIVVQENRLRLDTGEDYHTVICSYFRAKMAKELVLSPGESLDKLLD